MLSKPLPQNPQELLKWDWAEYKPLYQELNERRITVENIDIWLTDWSHLNECVEEYYNRLYYAITANTADKKAQQRYEDFADKFLPGWMEAENLLKRQLLSSGQEPANFSVQIRTMRAEADLFRPENLPLISEEQKLSATYDRIMGAQTVHWEGQERTISQLHPYQQEHDRTLRERAWRAGAERQLQDWQAIGDLWQKLLHLRRSIAANARKPDYRTYRWQELLRFDYTPADTQRFQAAIEDVVVPAAERIYERRRIQLGLDTLRPWDLEVDPLDRPPLHPFDTVDELVEKTSAVFLAVHPSLAEYFETMRSENLLDLANRRHKGPGAYCIDFSLIHRPFIFANAVGLHHDVQTMLHESGHAFHTFEAYALPYNQQHHTGSEFAEVASMGMELLAGRFLDIPGGFYNKADANRARVQHLQSNILFWPYMAVVDAFQHWVYTSPQAAEKPENCDAQWGALWQRFMRGVDWSGLEEVTSTGWQRKEHIHTVPFYYVEYGLAQLGAVQIWSRSLKDPAGAVSAYRRALALGGTVPLPQLYEAAGARLAFDADTLQEAVNNMETMIYSLDSEQPPVV
jgi:oligoendopeptidase F